MQPEMKPCKAEILKSKNESSLRRKYAELKSGRNNELEGEMCLQSRMLVKEILRISSIKWVTVYEKWILEKM